MSPSARRPDLVDIHRGAGPGSDRPGDRLLFTASYSTGVQRFGDPYYYIKRQIVGAALALAVFAVVTARSTTGSCSPWRCWTFAFLCPPGRRALDWRGGRRLGHGSTWAVFAFNRLKWWSSRWSILRRRLSRTRGRDAPLLDGSVSALGGVGGDLGLIMLQPDFGTGVAIVGTIVIMLFASGRRPGPPDGHRPVGRARLSRPRHQPPVPVARITSFINPWEDPLDSGWNIIQSLLAIGSGGLFGLGLGAGRQKFAYLPNSTPTLSFLSSARSWVFWALRWWWLLFFVLAWRGFASP